MRRITRISSYLLAVTFLFAAPACSPRLGEQAGTTGVTVFEGARLITGDGSAWGGHLLKGYVRPTLEVILIESPK